MALTTSSHEFYREYHGHPIAGLEIVAEALPGERGTLWLVGDSTMDNKYWLNSPMKPACNGYEKILRPPQSVPDVAYCINFELMQRSLGDKLCCINAAIEESTLGLRSGGKLLPHDEFVSRHIRDGLDCLVVSMGGNDIALRPNAWTIVSMITLLACPKALISSGWAPGLHHFVSLFRDATAAYVRSVLGERRPRCVAVCMLYYLDTRPGGSWADFVLKKLNYDTDPAKLQLVMRKVYEYGTSQLQLGRGYEGVSVVPVPMYEALDGTQTADYVQRVEPSAQGGAKLAKLILDRLVPALADGAGGASAAGASANSSRGVGAGGAGARRDDHMTATMPEAVHNRGSVKRGLTDTG